MEMFGLRAAHAADIELNSPSTFDGGQPIVLDAAWFGGAADAAMRVEIVDSTNGVSYLYAGTSVQEVSWNPPAVGKYKLSLQRQDGAAWVSTGYMRDLTVNGITTVTADDIELTIPGPGEGVAYDTFVDIESGVRSNEVVRPLAYSASWNEGANGVKIYQNGALVFDWLGEGTTEWRPLTNGMYVLTCQTTAGDVKIGTALTAKFFVSGMAQISSARANQHFPWNGKVDIDFTISGVSGDSSVSLLATDIGGATNLPIRTLYVDASTSPQTGVKAMLGPGAHRLVWDADADIAGDADFGRVAINIMIVSSDCARTVTFDPNGGAFESDASATNSMRRMYYEKTSVYGELPVVAREYHEFFGWSTATNGESFVSAEDLVPLSDVSLFAVWNHLTAPRNLGYGGPGGYYHSLAWDPVPGAVSYEMYIVAHGETDMSKARMTFELTENWFGSNDDDVDAALNGGDVYIRAKDADGNVGPFSSMYQGRWPT